MGVSIELVRQFNWVDILVVIVVIRILYIAFRQGLVVELFKLLGAFFAVFISLHYYSRLSDKVIEATNIPAEETDLVILVLLIGLILIVFKFVREGFLVTFKIETKSIIDKWVGVFFGIARAALVSSLFLVALFFSQNEYMQNSIKRSYLGLKDLIISPQVYLSCFEGVYKKFSPEDKLNTALFETLELELENY
jgi:uncharacterized membrane protein required for colicin V production